MSTSAERKRKQRLLKRLGIFKIEVYITARTSDVLVDTAHLQQWDADDRQAIQEAVQRLLDNLQSQAVTCD